MASGSFSAQVFGELVGTDGGVAIGFKNMKLLGMYDFVVVYL